MDKASNKSILASQKLPILLYLAYKLHQILQTPFLTHITVKHHDWVYIPEKNVDA